MALNLPPRLGRKYKSPDSAAFKLWGEEKNGEKFTLYSPDWKGKMLDPNMGLRWLLKVIASNTDSIKVAVIYDKRGGANREFYKWAEGATKREI